MNRFTPICFNEPKVIPGWDSSNAPTKYWMRLALSLEGFLTGPLDPCIFCILLHHDALLDLIDQGILNGFVTQALIGYRYVHLKKGRGHVSPLPLVSYYAGV